MNTIHRFDLTKKRFPINRARRFLPLACAVALMLPIAPILGSGFTGRTYVRECNGGIGSTIANVTLSFVKEGSTSAVTTTTDASGHYSITLNPGRYYVLATHRNYEDYTSAPGFAVVGGNTVQTANFFLREPRITTVLVLRHAEKAEDSTLADKDLPLTIDGEKRALRLRAALLRAGVTAVYSTDTVRTRSTVKPLADLFSLTIQEYDAPSTLKTTVIDEHLGDVILVAAHSPTVGAVVNAFEAHVPIETIGDFDNLYVVSVTGTTSSVVNLQYALDSASNLTKNDPHAMTLLLVGTSLGGDPRNARDLAHAVRSADVKAIFTSTENNPLLASLATALSLPWTNFNGGDMPGFVAQLKSSHANDTVVIGAGKAELQELIRQLGGSPFPVIYDSDVDHFIVVTRFESGAVRVVPMRL